MRMWSGADVQKGGSLDCSWPMRLKIDLIASSTDQVTLPGEVAKNQDQLYRFLFFFR